MSIRDNPAKSMLLRLLGRGARSVAAGIVALTLLSPFLQGFVLLTQAGNPSCGMSCCKGGKICCCHRSGHGVNNQGPGWASRPECAKGCGQCPRLSGSPWWSPTPGGFLAGPSLRRSRLVSRLRSAPSRPGIERALFERPPPSLG